MKTTNNILSKIFFFLILAAGWGGGAWAAPFVPTFEPTYNADGHWYFIKFTNNGYYMYNNGTGVNVGITTAAPNTSNRAYWWQLVGNQNEFVLVNGNGQYLKRTTSGGNNGFYQPQDGAAGAARLCFDQFKTGSEDVWEIKNLDLGSGRCYMNPQSSSISHWDNDDNGNRLVFEVIPTVLEASPAPENGRFSSNTKWYTMKNDRSGSFMSTAFSDNNGLQIRRNGQGVMPTTDAGYWCFVKATDNPSDKKYYIYNREAGAGQVLGTTYPSNDNSARTKLYEGTENESGVGKVYEVDVNGSGYYLRSLGPNGITGTNTWFIDDPRSSTYFTAWNDASGPKTSPGNRFYLYRAEIPGIILEDSEYTLSPANGQVASLNSIRIAISKDGYDIKSAAEARAEGQSFTDVMPVLTSSSRGAYTATGIVPTGTPGEYDLQFGEIPRGEYSLTIPTATFYAKAESEYTPISTLNSTYTLVDILNSAVKLVFKDGNGNLLSNETVIYTPVGGAPQNITSSLIVYDFHNAVFSEDCFSVSETFKTLRVEFDKASNTLTFTIIEDRNYLQFSDAPVNGQWASNTHWFTIRNNRSNISQTWQYKYLTTAEGGVRDDLTMYVQDLGRDVLPTDRGGLWCLVGNINQYRIQNAAYGPDFCLVRLSNGKYTMAHISEIPAGAEQYFSSPYTSNMKGGASIAYQIRIGTSGDNHIHVNDKDLNSYNSHDVNDSGNAFMFTVADEFYGTFPQYDVYKVEWTGAAVNGMTIDYADGAKTFGRRSSANDGDYLIVEKGSPIDVSNFAVTGSKDYRLAKTASSNVAGHACKALALTIADALATVKWTVKVNGGYIVTFAGLEYRDGETFMMRPNITPEHLYFTVNAPADKFVWGPVIDTWRNTVTFEVRDKATALETGLYQLVLKNEADITKANNLITKFAENVNTSSHYVYLAPSVYKLDGAQFKFTGVPTYGGEAATYIYIKKNSDTNVDILSAGGAEIKNVACSFANGEITFSDYGIKNYTLEDNQHTIIYEPKEMPALANGTGPITFALTPISLTAYDSYYIKYAGDYTNSDRFDYKKSSPTGISNYGKDELFIVNKGTTFAAEDFVSDGIMCTSVEIVKQPTETEPGELRLTLAAETEEYSVRLIGDAAKAEDRVVYHEKEYADGTVVNVPVSAAPTALEFKTNVTDRFVWGPVFDYEGKTVTFEIREAASTLQAGTWVQMMMRDKQGQVSNGGLKNGSVIELINGMSNLTNKGHYIYAKTADNNTGWPLHITGYAGEQYKTQTYVYIESVATNSATILMQNGMYLNSHAQGNSAKQTAPLVYQSATKSFLWNEKVIPENNLGGKPGIGYTSRTSVGNVEFIITPVNVKAYKITGTGGNKVEYTGSAKVIGSKMVADGYFLFLESDQSLEGEGSTIDASQFTLKGSIATITNISAAQTGGYTTLTFTTTAPTYSNTIIHRQHDVYDRLEEVGAMMPGSNYIKKDGGMIDQPYAANFKGTGYNDNDKRIQNTSVFNITQYVKPGERTECVLPYTKNKGVENHVAEYQRWYDYTTERCLADEIITLENSTSTLGSFHAFTNGHSNYGPNAEGTIVRQTDHRAKADIKLPSNMTELFVAVDASEFQDSKSLTNRNLMEPSLNMRVIYHIISAHKMAEKLQVYNAAKPVDTWWEDKQFYVPNVKRGSDTYRNNADLIPLDMPFTNYWIYKTTGDTSNDNLMPIVAENGNYTTLRNNIEIVIEGTATDKRPMTDYLEVDVFDGNPGRIGSAAYINSNHFFYYKVKGDGTTRVIPDGSQAVIKIYAKNGTSATTKYQLAKFTLNFQSDSEPLAISNVIGNATSTRSVDYFLAKKFKQVASMTFQEKEMAFTKIPNRRNDDNEPRTYAFPIDFDRTSYGYSPSYTYGNYSVTRQGWGIKFYPVALYERNIKNPSSTSMAITDDYFFYIDAAESPGQVASVPLEGTLCAGTRLYCYGWLGSGNAYNGGSDPTGASVVIQLVGRRNNGTEEVLASYLSGTLTDVSYDSNGNEMRSLSYGRTPSMEKALYMEPAGTQVGVWNSIGFSFLVSKSGFDSYEMRIINNCFSTAGGDYSLDDFRVFANPPKGDVDFTTPLCSDKVRHAKVYADYDMLRDMSSTNDQNTSGGIATTYCFIDAEIFDNYSEDEYLIKDMFEIDETGNHNLKAKYNPTTTPAVADVINHAFRDALVGSRYVKDEVNHPERTDYGFHTYVIDSDYESIQEYAYNDSKNEVIYREQKGDGIRRVVFKEDVVRGEMQMVPAEQGKEDLHPAYWPNLRPSRTYYLVFSPMLVDQDLIDEEHTATSVFGIHESCSFFGKFTTKDPMHVILDNADIESDLPITAVCYDEKKEFHFDMPALKLDKPIVDEAYCISDENLNGKIVPSTQGANHYKYEASFNNEDVYGVIKNLPYDWWMGGTLGDTKYRGTIDEYLTATHPTITYSGPKDIAHKQDQAPVNIAQAMTDFRFFYPDFGKSGGELDWSTVTRKDYNNETGYGLLDSEIQTIKDFVDAKIILLHRNTYDMPLTYKEAEELQAQEVNDLMEDEMSNRILKLALKLNEDESIASSFPLKAIEGTVLNMISSAGRQQLTIEELGSFTHEQLKGIATALKTNDKLTDVTTEQIDAMSEGDLRRAVENALKAMADDEMQTFASNESNFPNIGHEKRAYLVVRALDILSRETVVDLMKEKPNATTDEIRAALRAKMIELFSKQKPVVLRKMWADASAELTEAERIALLTVKGQNGEPATILNPTKMEDADKLAVLVEDALAKIVNNVIADMKSDRYIHFTLVPIMPSQENFVDEPYIFCPDPRGVKLRITNKKPQMFDGFADMPYPDDMDNVPVRIGLQQINAVPYDEETADAKTLRIPLRRLGRAQTDGERDQIEVNEHGYGRYLFLESTNDPAYKREGSTADPKTGLTKAALLAVANPEDDYPADEENEIGRHHLIGQALNLQAIYSDQDNFMDIQLNPNFKFREGYTYRVGFNFVESKRMLNSKGEVVTNPETGEVVYERNQSCFGTMLFDIKIVPEYQKWTGAVSNDWTNDRNWQRADRTDLHADNLPTGEVITGSTAYAKATAEDAEAAKRYPTNETNETAESFIPMAFTNTLIAEGASHMPALYRVDVPERSKKEMVGEKEVTIPGHFLGEPKPKVEGVPNDDKTPAAPLKPTASVNAKYDMEVYAATGSWSDVGNYECGLFGTYVAKGITFEPATSLYNAQLLNYQKAWVEYALNTKRWYTLASPLQETYSGEWYSPTGSGDTKGKQLTPHFYGINYKPALNDRFNPAYYQRSWDKATVNLYQCEQESAIFGENPYNAYRALTWSKVYNDVQVDYTNGGFSVKTLLADEDESPEHASEYHEVLVRMPKEDAAFDYYDPANVHPGHNTPIARTAAHHRLNSDLLNTKAGLVQTLKNDNESEYYLVANPFIAPMDMDAFFTENTQFEAGKYWILADDKQEANVKVDDTWISTNGTSNGDVAPLQAFFVKRNGKTDQEISVTYTAEMQAANNGTALPLKMRAQAIDDAPAVFTISNGESDALCYFAGDADAEYREGEDAELLLDSNLSDHVTTVFTAASGQALHVNVLPQSVTTIPVGVIAPEDDTETVLTFTGVEHLEAVMPEQPHLYDAANGAFSPVEEGTEIAIEGTSSGRYYIVSGKHLPYTGIDSFADDADEDADLYNLHGIRVASPQKGNITIRGTRKEYHKR